MKIRKKYLVNWHRKRLKNLETRTDEHKYRDRCAPQRGQRHTEASCAEVLKKRRGGGSGSSSQRPPAINNNTHGALRIV